MASNGIYALGALYDLTAQRLVRYALALTRCQHDAEDATQAALVRMAMRPQLLARSRYPWPYLLRVVRNEALVIVRRRRRNQLHATVGVITRERSPAVDNDLEQQVSQALRKLPPPQAEVIALKIWENMTFAEIGRVLGKSPNTVASRYRYAIEKLAHHLHSASSEAIYE